MSVEMRIGRATVPDPHLVLVDVAVAATCLGAGAEAVATRNTTDFTGTSLTLIHPWTAPAA